MSIPPPTQKVTPAVELTPEEIMAYIIPPPPSQASLENLTITEPYQETESPEENVTRNVELRRSNSNGSARSNIIEYATVDRKGAFSCCAKNKTDRAASKIDEGKVEQSL